jgi:hypothetical protein
MHSKQVWSLSHDITASFRLDLTPIFQKSTPDLHTRNSVRVHPYTHPQHITVLKHFVYIDMDVGCTPSGLGASAMT